MRQRDVEIERLRDKLRHIAEKEKDSAQRHRATLTSLQRGDISFASNNSSFSSPPKSPNSSSSSLSASAAAGAGAARSQQKPNNSSSVNNNTTINTSTFGGRGGGIGAQQQRLKAKPVLAIPPSVSDLLEALEEQRDVLEQRNAELDEQVLDLSAALRDQTNRERLSSFAGTSRNASKPSSTTTRRNAVGEDENAAGFEQQGEEKGSPFDDDSGLKGGDDDADQVLDGRTEVGGHGHRSETARAMYAKIQEQSRRIEKLLHRCDVHKSQEEEATLLKEQFRARLDELREEIENLRLELEARPSMRQWSEKQRELQEAEEKLHDLTLMRGEAAELAAWRKHLSTRDRIKVDKKNHELGLWLLDSLPKVVTKEVLQGVCRELDVSDVSEVVPSIVKLKTVVHAVPRMERFISQVCGYLFQRDSRARGAGGEGLGGGDRPTMEDVLPVLQGWWADLRRLEGLQQFQDRVLAELRRREQLLVQAKGGDGAGAGSSSEDGEMAWAAGGMFEWTERERGMGIALVRDMVDFQVEVMRHKKRCVNQVLTCDFFTFFLLLPL